MAEKLPSELVVIAAPMSFAGSAQRIWRLTRLTTNDYGRVALIGAAAVLIVCAWIVVLVWYALFAVLLLPYRVLRRGARKRKREALQHREVLAALEQNRQA